MTDFDPQALIDSLKDQALTLGVFEAVNGAEPVNTPTVTGITAALWVQEMGASPKGSGLAATTGLLVVNWRLYSSMLAEPVDAIDPALLRALHALMTAISGDFEVGSIKPGIDLLGSTGVTMRARAGYVEADDHVFRIYDLPVPIQINDIWAQAA